MRLSAGVFFKLIFEAKKQGKGRLGRGRVYAKLIGILSGTERIDIINAFGGSIDKFLLRLIRSETEYPYSMFTVCEPDVYISDINRIKHDLLKIKDFCSEVLDEEKIISLVYTLLGIVKSDTTINTLIYGSRIIPKNALFGSVIHPKQICIEALLLSLLYHIHKYPSDEDNTEICLAPAPYNLDFELVHYNDISSLNLEYETDIISFLKRHSFTQNELSEKYKLDIKINNNITDSLPESGNIFVSGESGCGITTLMLSGVDTNNRIFLYINLASYSEALMQTLLLKYRYLNEYNDYRECCIIEGEEAVIKESHRFESLLKSSPVNGEAQFVLLLDGLSSCTLKKYQNLVNDIETAAQKWKNVHIIASGRKVPNMSVFDSFIKAEMFGVNENEIRRYIVDYGSLNDNLKALFKYPLFLKRYLDNKAEGKTYGELLDYYYSEYLSEKYSEHIDIVFVIRYILPFIGKRMSDFNCNSIKRSEAAEAVDRALSILLDNEKVYLNYTLNHTTNTGSITDKKDAQYYTELILDTEIMCENTTCELSFTSYGDYSYFAAKYIINAVEILDTAYGKEQISEKQAVFKYLDLGSVWFENKEIYRLIGEMTGDYKNSPEAAHYHKTQLDTLLEMCREFECFRTTENIIQTMASVRNNVICDVDFSGTSLPLSIPSCICFSDDSGELPCDFSRCHVMYIGILEPLLFSVCSDDNRFILAGFENAYFVMWDCENRSILWTQDLRDCLENDSEYCYAEFGDNSISLYGTISGITVNIADGVVRNKFEVREFHSDNYEKWLDNGCIPQNADYDNLHVDILQQLSHFKNCDFRDAYFEFDKYKNLLEITGAII